MTHPIINITMPVFNRYELTQRALLSLHKLAREIPFCVTVVSNGSEKKLEDRLIEFHEAGLIDHLFLLPDNMGVACAANIGWQAVDAPVYMKLDNDIILSAPHVLKKLFNLWRHGSPISTLGPTFEPDLLRSDAHTQYTQDGILGVCHGTLCGQAILIPKEIFDLLGFWNDDYGLYGAEDGDYSVRMECAALPQYYYNAPDYIQDMGQDEAETYLARGVSKHREHQSIFHEPDGLVGMYIANHFLFNTCLRSWKVLPRYEIEDIDRKYRVRLRQTERYTALREALEACRFIISRHMVDGKINIAEFDENTLQALRKKLAPFNNV